MQTIYSKFYIILKQPPDRTFNDESRQHSTGCKFLGRTRFTTANKMCTTFLKEIDVLQVKIEALVLGISNTITDTSTMPEV